MSDLTRHSAHLYVFAALVGIGCGDGGSPSSSGGSGTQAMVGGSGGGAGGAGTGALGGTGGASGTGGGELDGGVGAGGAAGGAGGPPEPGRCAPSEGPDVDTLQAAGEAVTTVAADGPVIIHEGFLYLTQGGVGLVRVPESAGGTVEVLVPNMEEARLLGFEDGFAYFKQSYDGPYARVPTSDWSAPAEVQGGTPRGFARVVSGGYLYGHGGDPGPNQVWRQAFADGAVDVLAEVAEDVGGLDVADGFVYFTDDSFGVENLFRVPIEGGSVEQLSRGSHFSLQIVRALGDKIYWADGYAMFVTDPSIADPAASTQRLGYYGPNPSAFGNGTRGCLDMMVRGDRVYWVDDGGNVGWTSMNRVECGAVLIQASAFPDRIVLGPDHAYVFGGTFGDELWRTPL